MEKMARLTPEVKEFSEKIDSSGFDGLTASDVAAALAKIKGDDAPSCLMRFKYANDVRSGRQLLARIKGSIITSCDVPEHMNTDLAMLVLEHTLMPPHCPVCHGRKEVMTGTLKIVCRVCSGSGIASKCDAHMAQALHITKLEWTGHYSRQYCTITSIVNEWERLGKRTLIDALLFY